MRSSWFANFDFFPHFRLKKTGHPNTYTFTKALAEDILNFFRKRLPIVIVRPSIIGYSKDEPFPGCIEGMNAGIGLVSGFLTGMLRTCYISNDANVKTTPADFVINAAIVSAWKRSMNKKEDVLFFNCTDSEKNSLTCRKFLEIISEGGRTFPPYNTLIWYPQITPTTSHNWHLVSLILFQVVPAIFFDIFQVLSGRKAMYDFL